MIGLVPYIFRRIKFRRIRRKKLCMNPGMLKKPFFNFCTPVNSSAIPKKNHMPSEVFSEPLEKGAYVQSRKRPDTTSDIKGDVLLKRRYRKCADGRNSVLFIEMPEKRRLSFRRPCAADIGDKQESAFIQKYEVGTKPFGVFLYAASDNVSNERFLFRFFGARGVPASDNSIPYFLRFSRYDWDGIVCRNFSLFAPRCALVSKGLSGNRRLKALLKEALLISSFGYRKVSQDALELALAEEPPNLFFDTTDTIGRLSSWMLQANAQSKRGILFPASRAESPGDDATGVAEVFLVVS